MLSNFIKHQRFPLKTASFMDWVKLLLALTMKKQKMPQTESKGHGGPTRYHGGPGPDLRSLRPQPSLRRYAQDPAMTRAQFRWSRTQTPPNFPKTPPVSPVNRDYHAVTPDLSLGVALCKNNS